MLTRVSDSSIDQTGKIEKRPQYQNTNHKPSTPPQQTITCWKRLQSNTHTHKPVLPRALIPSPLVGFLFGEGVKESRRGRRRVLPLSGHPNIEFVEPRAPRAPALNGAPWRGWAVPGQRNHHLASVRLQYVQQRERFGRGRANDGACGCGEGWVSCSSIFPSDDPCAPDGSPCFCCPTAVAGRSLSMIRSYGLVSCFVDE